MVILVKMTTFKCLKKIWSVGFKKGHQNECQLHMFKMYFDTVSMMFRSHWYALLFLQFSAEYLTVYLPWTLKLFWIALKIKILTSVDDGKLLIQNKNNYECGLQSYSIHPYSSPSFPEPILWGNGGRIYDSPP